MNFSEIYNKKVISIEEALGKVKSGDEIVVGLGAAEAKGILEKLHLIHENVEDVHVVTCLPMRPYDYFMDEKYLNSFIMEGWFYNGDMRKVHKTKSVSFIPNHLHFAAHKRMFHRKPNIYIGNASAMDSHGNLSLGVSATYERKIMENADLVILEVNKNTPRTFGDTVISVQDVDFIVESDYFLPEIPIANPNEKDCIIGDYIAQLVENESTIQLGIGGIPNAVAKALDNKKDLGIHTEMFTDGMVDLFYKGVINNSYKRLKKYKSIATFALGTKKLYDFINDNPSVELLNGYYVTDPYVIGQNNKMVSINTTMEIDITGQCASESIGVRQFSGSGGQHDTAVGAQICPDGKSIIALYSTTSKKEADGSKKTISKIAPMLTSGAIVTLSRNDVDYVVTEYGVASLRGTSVRERVKRLINIAHPDFRDELKFKSNEFMLW